MATGGSYEVDKKTGKATLKEKTSDPHAEGRKTGDSLLSSPAKPNTGKSETVPGFSGGKAK